MVYQPLRFCALARPTKDRLCSALQSYFADIAIGLKELSMTCTTPFAVSMSDSMIRDPLTKIAPLALVVTKSFVFPAVRKLLPVIKLVEYSTDPETTKFPAACDDAVDVLLRIEFWGAKAVTSLVF